MSHNKNGKTGYGQSGSRKVDGFPAKVDGNISRQLRSHLIARPNEVHEFLRNQYLTCLEGCSSSGIDAIFGENGGDGLYPVFNPPQDPIGDNKVDYENGNNCFKYTIRRKML
jgi:hypothetical protein